MNEQIKDLVARAKNRSQYLLATLCDKTNRTSDEVTEQEKQELFNKTFALLIVQECVDMAEQYGSGGAGSEFDVGYTSCANTLADEFKKRFGVEE